MKTYEQRVRALEAQGLTRSDAQGVIDAEDLTAQRQATHTRGPWSIYDDGPGGSDVILAHINGANYDIAYISNDETEGRPENERAANARLIASAPDLLAALKDARERLEYLEPDYFDDASHETEWRDYLAQTDALIAKAEGRD